MRGQPQRGSGCGLVLFPVGSAPPGAGVGTGVGTDPPGSAALANPERDFWSVPCPHPTAPAIPAPINALRTPQLRDVFGSGVGGGGQDPAGWPRRRRGERWRFVAGPVRASERRTSIHRLEKFPASGGSQTSCSGERELALSPASGRSGGSGAAAGEGRGGPSGLGLCGEAGTPPLCVPPCPPDPRGAEAAPQLSPQVAPPGPATAGWGPQIGHH